MKNITIILPISLLVISTFSNCRTVKEKTSLQESMIQHQYTGTQSRQATYSHQWDSTGRRWFFSTDSVFYYHPDSGLYAKQGILSIRENNLNVQMQHAVVDSTRIETTTEETLSLWKTYYRKVKDSRWTLIIAGVLLLGGVYCWLKYRRVAFSIFWRKPNTP
ncbi:hypothetical protein [Sphingobacterium faecale]|uniref:PepSY domain-containing protein n=1 Tax=Sphingobacterium faecale TaxID=2803775 RepID=A0ABS1R955_9SPHI|nr:hypothetical protein [Sphingobacterium faecale]MBL1411238.1 hypothetical protein [Sphingobacterium faecale]